MTRTTPTWSAADPVARLVVDGRVVAPLWIARTDEERTTGLLGTDRLDGALLIERCRAVHTLRMRHALDVAFVAADGRVLATRTMRPWRLSATRWRASSVVEAPSGAFADWGLRAGSTVAVAEA